MEHFEKYGAIGDLETTVLGPVATYGMEEPTASTNATYIQNHWFFSLHHTSILPLQLGRNHNYGEQIFLRHNFFTPFFGVNKLLAYQTFFGVKKGILAVTSCYSHK